MNWDLRHASARPHIVNGCFAYGDGSRCPRKGDTIIGPSGVAWAITGTLETHVATLRLDVENAGGRRFARYPIDLN